MNYKRSDTQLISQAQISEAILYFSFYVSTTSIHQQTLFALP